MILGCLNSSSPETKQSSLSSVPASTPETAEVIETDESSSDDIAQAPDIGLSYTFDPLVAQVGDHIADLTLTMLEINVRETENGPSSDYGTATFDGEAIVTGQYFLGSGGGGLDIDPPLPCFVVDETADYQLPRVDMGDDPSWNSFRWSQFSRTFCFTNPEEVARSLGENARTATIRIDSFAIYYARTEGANTARFVELVAGTPRQTSLNDQD